MSGTELITALKARPETAGIPIVIVAGKNSGFDANEHRANFAIFKDIDIEAQLDKALEALMGTRVIKPKRRLRSRATYRLSADNSQPSLMRQPIHMNHLGISLANLRILVVTRFANDQPKAIPASAEKSIAAKSCGRNLG